MCGRADYTVIRTAGLSDVSAEVGGRFYLGLLGRVHYWAGDVALVGPADRLDASNPGKRSGAGVALCAGGVEGEVPVTRRALGPRGIRRRSKRAAIVLAVPSLPGNF